MKHYSAIKRDELLITYSKMDNSERCYTESKNPVSKG